MIASNNLQGKLGFAWMTYLIGQKSSGFHWCLITVVLPS